MAIGVKVDPKVIAAGQVVLVQERRGFVSDDDRARGVVGEIERHDVLLLQPTGGQLAVRFRVRDKLDLPVVGYYAAFECRVSEGSFRDDSGQDRQFVSLVAERPAFDALDMIQSSLAAA